MCNKAGLLCGVESQGDNRRTLASIDCHRVEALIGLSTIGLKILNGLQRFGKILLRLYMDQGENAPLFLKMFTKDFFKKFDM